MTRVYDITPIPTTYRGRLYRSRTEARWATFFHTAHIQAQYEPRYYDLCDGDRYLPDFTLFDGNLFAEVKPTEPTHEERWKAIQLASELRKPFIFLVGPPSRHTLYPMFFSHIEQGQGPIDYDDPPWGRIEQCRRCPGSVLATYWQNNVNEIAGCYFLGRHDDIDRCADRWAVGVNGDAVHAAYEETFAE